MTQSLKQQAWDFAIEIMQTLAGVLPRGDLGIELTTDETNTNFVLTCNDPKGVELQIDNQTVMRLEIDYKLSGDRTGQWLKVITSTIAVVPENKGVPFFRYDFIDDARNIPVAHFNVHAERDDFIQALVSKGKSAAAKNRRREFLNQGKIPRLANFHFPVGGRRFRPSLEEILRVIIEEFGIDRRPTWNEVLDAGHARHLAVQLKAAVRDNPEVAIKALENLGYAITKQRSDSQS